MKKKKKTKEHLRRFKKWDCFSKMNSYFYDFNKIFLIDGGLNSAEF